MSVQKILQEEGRAREVKGAVGRRIFFLCYVRVVRGRGGNGRTIIVI